MRFQKLLLTATVVLAHLVANQLPQLYAQGSTDGSSALAANGLPEVPSDGAILEQLHPSGDNLRQDTTPDLLRDNTPSSSAVAASPDSLLGERHMKTYQPLPSLELDPPRIPRTPRKGRVNSRLPPALNAPEVSDLPTLQPHFLATSAPLNRGQYGGIFPRTAAEYGPPGFVRRRALSGPAAPILVPTHASKMYTVPTEDSLSFVTPGSFPNSYRLPGSKTSYRWGGFVHLDGMFTFDPMRSTDDFVTSSIPVPAERGQNANFTPRYTRLDFETHTDSRFGDVKTFLQVDFFNGNVQSEFGSFPLRLRFAYVDIEHWRFGNDASVFMDYDAFPNVLDYEGPGGIILIRQSLVRYTHPVTDRFKVAFAAEQPWSDLTLTDAAGNPLDGQRIQDMPDFTSHLRYDNDLGHLQLAGILRKLTFQPLSGDKLNAIGYGLNLAGDLHPWASLLGTSPTDAESLPPLQHALAKCRLTGAFAAGYGISRYIQDSNGLGLDAAIDAAGDLEALFARGWFVGYEHWWTPRWTSSITYAANANSGIATLPNSTYGGAQYFATNLMWIPIDNTFVGVEYLWGERENLDDQSARARRLQLGIRFAF